MRMIDAMYHYYGKSTGRCENCPHFVKTEWDRVYYKCTVYGVSSSEATDWRKSYTACGLIDKPFPDGETRVVTRIRPGREYNKPVEGQTTMFWEG